jgi:hypothetical protein
MALTDQDFYALNAQSPETLARWYCLLNTWEWPDNLPNPETVPSGEPPLTPKMPRRSAVMEWITERIGAKAVSEEWNCRFGDERLRMTVSEHSEWWDADESQKLELSGDYLNRANLVFA